MIDSGRYPAEYWSRSVSVPVRTLDGLIDEFGVAEVHQARHRGFRAARRCAR